MNQIVYPSDAEQGGRKAVSLGTITLQPPVLQTNYNKAFGTFFARLAEQDRRIKALEETVAALKQNQSTS
jgi:hypothetical protein